MWLSPTRVAVGLGVRLAMADSICCCRSIVWATYGSREWHFKTLGGTRFAQAQRVAWDRPKAAKATDAPDKFAESFIF